VFAKRPNQSSHPPLSGAFAAPTEAAGAPSPSQNGHKRSESIEQLVDRLSQPKKVIDEDTKEKVHQEAERRRSKSRERTSKLMQNPVLFGGIDNPSAETSELDVTSQRSKNETKVGFKETPEDFLARLSVPKATAPDALKEKVQQEAERRRAKSRERSGTAGGDEDGKKPSVLSPSPSAEKVDEDRGRSRAAKPVNTVSASSSTSSFLDRLSKPTASSASKTAAKPVSASSSKTSIKSVDSLRAARK